MPELVWQFIKRTDPDRHTYQVADVITDTNNNDGVGKAVEKYVLR